MFHLKLHPHRRTTYSPQWHELFSHKQPIKKQVVTHNYTTPYEPRTLAESIHAACMKTLGFTGEAETTALRVCDEIEQWLVDKEEVTSADIRRRAAAALHKYNPRAAYAYLPVKEYEIQEDEYGFIQL